MRQLVPFLSRHPLLLIILVALYIVMPIDLFPEALIGPLGYWDDFLVLLVPAMIWQWTRKLKSTKKKSEKPHGFKKVIDTTAEFDDDQK